MPDGARARDFYGAVLGWTAVPGRVPDGWQVEGTTPMVGIGGGATEPGTVPMYAVDDIEVAVAAVRTAGGEAGEIERQSYGLSALCRDDQGLPFWLGQLELSRTPSPHPSQARGEPRDGPTVLAAALLERRAGVSGGASAGSSPR